MESGFNNPLINKDARKTGCLPFNDDSCFIYLWAAGYLPY